jgi:CHASE3 domain sensor protein
MAYQKRATNLRNQIVEALGGLSDDESEPRFLLVEEVQLVNLVAFLEQATAAKSLEVIREAMHDGKDYVEELIKGAAALSLEEKETMMERLVKQRTATSKKDTRRFPD